MGDSPRVGWLGHAACMSVPSALAAMAGVLAAAVAASAPPDTRASLPGAQASGIHAVASAVVGLLGDQGAHRQPAVRQAPAAQILQASHRRARQQRPEHLGEQARKSAVGEFSWDVIASRTMACYRQLASDLAESIV